MSSSNLKSLLIAGAMLGAVQFSCRPASYEIIKPKKATEQANPVQVGPAVDPVSPSGQPVVGNMPPTARIEVIWDGQVVTKVRVNRPVTIHPSADTLDPDDIGKSQCANPGIVKAQYDIAGQDHPSRARDQGCDSLGVPYTFMTPGEYKLGMVVTSNENETATASMTLIVIDENQPITDDGGFTIQAIPLLASVGQNVDFYGYCETKLAHTIGWQFGDTGTGAGAQSKHAYVAIGQYVVNATCAENQTGHIFAASLTVVVVTTAPTFPGRPTTPSIPDGTTDGSVTPPVTPPGSTDGTDGGQCGCDQNPEQKQPNQGIPVQQG